MNIDFVDEFTIPIIVAACLAIGTVMKYWLPTDNKWIPTVLLIVGAVSGAILFGADYEGIVKGMISGLAAVGLNQLFKQHLKLPMDVNELKAMGKGDGDTAAEYAEAGDDDE